MTHPIGCTIAAAYVPMPTEI